MTLVSPSVPNPGDEITAASIATPVEQLADTINGNLGDENIASISGSKLADSTVATSKLQDGAVTAAKQGDSGWQTLALPGSASGTHRYRKIGNRVTIEVSLTGISVTNGSALNLTLIPSGYRPNSLAPVQTLGNGSAVWVGYVLANGGMTLTNRSGGTSTSVDAMVTYLVD